MGVCLPSLCLFMWTPENPPLLRRPPTPPRLPVADELPATPIHLVQPFRHLITVHDRASGARRQHRARDKIFPPTFVAHHPLLPSGRPVTKYRWHTGASSGVPRSRRQAVSSTLAIHDNPDSLGDSGLV